MAIGVLVEVLRPSGGQAGGTAGKPPPKDEKGSKEWIKYKLKASTLLQGRLRVKATEMLPGIIGAILSWILNKTAYVVGWVSQNLWALVVSIHDHQEVKIISRCIIIKFNVRDNTRLLQFQ